MNKRSLLIALAVVVVLVIGALLYYRSSHQVFQANQQLSEEEVQAILSSVGRHIRLPEGEEPLIATIADINMLMEREPFYAGAQNGDVLLLYPNAGKAILYDAEGDIIINVGPIVLDNEAPADASSEATPEEEPADTPETTPAE